MIGFKKDGETTVMKLLTEQERTPPTIKIDYLALAKMKGYVDGCNEEVAWLAACKKEADCYRIYDTFICQQETSLVTAELHESGLQELASRLVKEGRTNELENIRVWGHSHVNMATSPSGTDDSTFEEYYKNCEYFIRLIMNKIGEMQIDIAETERKLIFYNVKWTIGFPKELEKYEKERNKLSKRIEEINTLMESHTTEVERIALEEGKAAVEKYTKTARPIGGKYWHDWRDSDFDDYSSYYNYGGYETYKPEKKKDKKQIKRCELCGEPGAYAIKCMGKSGLVLCADCRKEIRTLGNVYLKMGKDVSEWAICDVFTGEEAERFATCSRQEMAEELLKKKEFEYYDTKNKWNELKEIIEDYYTLMLE